MEEKKSILENASVKQNPRTTIPGHILMFIATLMIIFKYILPMFPQLKLVPAPYHWGAIVAIGAVGLLFLYMTDEYFARIFIRGDKYIGKVTGTDKEEGK